LNEPVPGGTGQAPDIINWASRDYGNRVGIFRMMEVLERHGVRGTVALNAEVCDDYPQIIEDARALGWEFMGHNQSNARYLHLMSPEEERRVVLATFERIEKATGRRPKSWLSSGLQESWQTLGYLVEAGASFESGRLHQRRSAVSDERRRPAPVLDPVLRGDQRSASDPPRRPLIGRVRVDDPPAVRHALPRGGTVGPRHGDLPAPLRHRRAAPDR